MVRYPLLALFWCLLATFQFLLWWLFLSPVLVLLKRDTYPSWLIWFQPDDTLAIGDGMFGSREAAFTKNYPIWLSRYVRSVMWGCRNPAYGWLSYSQGLKVNNVHYFTEAGTPNVDIGDFGYTLGTVTRTLTNGDGVKYFDWKHAGKWNDRLGYMLRFGWNLQPEFKNGEVRNMYVDIRPFISLH